MRRHTPLGLFWCVLLCLTLFWCDSLCFFEFENKAVRLLMKILQLRDPRLFCSAASPVHVSFHPFSPPQG